MRNFATGKTIPNRDLDAISNNLSANFAVGRARDKAFEMALRYYLNGMNPAEAAKRVNVEFEAEARATPDHISYIQPAFFGRFDTLRRHVFVLVDGIYFHVFGEKSEAREVRQQRGISSRKVSSKKLAAHVLEVADRLEQTQADIFYFK